MKKRIALVVLVIVALCFGQGNGINSYRTVTQSAPASDVAITQNTAILFHQLSWVDTGTVSSCTVALDSSPDGTTWTAGGIITGQTCTSNGNSSITSGNAKYVRITSTALSGGGSVQFFYKGWAYNPTPGTGTGTVTSITCGTGLTCSPGSPITTTGTISSSGGTTDGLSTFATLAVGGNTSVTSIATNSITVATTGVVYVFCGTWGSGTATLTMSDTLTSTITSLGDTGDNTTNANSRMHAWKIVPASNGSDAFTCGGGVAGSHMDVAAAYYPSPGNKVVDVSSFNNVNANQSGRSVSLTPTATDRVLVALFSVSSTADKFAGFSGYTLFQNTATSGNSMVIKERLAIPSGAFSIITYGITNQPMHVAALAVN